MDQVVASNPDDVDALLRRFDYQRKHVRSVQADTSDLRRALELDRSNPKALLSLARYMADPSTDTDEGAVSRASLYAAQDFLIESREKLPNEAYIPVSLSSIQIRLGRTDAAAATLEEAAEQFQKSPIVHTARAELAIEEGRTEEA